MTSPRRALRAGVYGVRSGRLLLLALLAGCVAPEPQAAASQAAQLPDLTGAHVDKRKFLLAATLLGSSEQRDKSLIATMTGAEVPQKTSDDRPPQGKTRASASFGRGRVAMRFTYDYLTHADGRYAGSMAFGFDTQHSCIGIDDIVAAFGPPSRLQRILRPHVAVGSREVEYLQRGRHVLFQLRPDCAVALDLAFTTQPK